MHELCYTAVPRAVMFVGAVQMIIVNIQGNGAYHLPQGGVSSPVNAATIKDFVDGYKAGSLERFQLSRG